MPRKKSAPRLEELCLNVAHRNLNTLQNAAKDLPFHLINVLHRKSVEHYSISVGARNRRNMDTPPPLPADLFINPRTEVLQRLDCYDKPAISILNKIRRICKNLQTVHLSEHINHLRSITINNPHILEMDLSGAECTDDHLSIIGKHCLQLQDLRLRYRNYITTKGLSCLPRKLVVLRLPGYSVAEYLNVLEYLPLLKRLINCVWHDVIEDLAKMNDSRFVDRKFEIEEIEISLHKPLIDNFLRTVRTKFPKLRSIEFNYVPDARRVADVLGRINHDLLTRIQISISADFVGIVAHLCPMLEDLYAYLIPEEPRNRRYLEKLELVPFKYLHKLQLDDRNHALTTNSFKYLLANCHHLIELRLNYFFQLTDRVIYEVLQSNPLKCLETVVFNHCKLFSSVALCEFLKSLDSLRKISFLECYHLSLDDKVKMERLIKEMDCEMDWNSSFPFQK